MDNIKDKVSSIIGSKKFYVVLFLILLFIAISMYVYKNHLKKIINKDYVDNKEFINKNNDAAADKDGSNGSKGNADLYFFYTEWCPHCKTDMPVWKKFKEQISSDGINGVKINFMEVECEKNKGLAEKYDVEAYPTIKLVYDGKVIEYDAKTEIDTLREFLNSSL